MYLLTILVSHGLLPKVGDFLHILRNNCKVSGRQQRDQRELVNRGIGQKTNSHFN